MKFSDELKVNINVLCIWGYSRHFEVYIYHLSAGSRRPNACHQPQGHEFAEVYFPTWCEALSPGEKSQICKLLKTVKNCNFVFKWCEALSPDEKSQICKIVKTVKNCRFVSKFGARLEVNIVA